MKARIVIISFCAAIAALQLGSCTKDQTKPAIVFECAVINDSTNTWNHTIKSIMDNSCTLPACHDANNAGQINLQTYAAAKNAFETRPMLCAIKHEGACITMPLARPKLNDTLIAKIECWTKNNYPE